MNSAIREEGMSQRSGTITLKFYMGRNTTTGEPQWQARKNGDLYVPHMDGHMPMKDGEAWECSRRYDQIGPANRRGKCVIIVWLIRKIATNEERAARAMA